MAPTESGASCKSFKTGNSTRSGLKESTSEKHRSFFYCILCVSGDARAKG